MLKITQQYLKEVEDAMRLIMARRKVNDTGAGEKSITSNANQNGGSVSAQLRFHEYLRFVDMGVGRGHPLGGLKSTVINLQASRKRGIAQIKDNTRRPVKVYSRVAYGKLTWLQNKLLYGFTEEAIAELKKELTNGTARNQ
ncbi:MAG TPA: hypothetical protein PKY29_04365 [Ferruginibacter sp.]|nr:hypothetical protein [Ferruginibacter sp.]HRQ20522.1 hypothetical protein [Ferruginibacter sp.]